MKRSDFKRKSSVLYIGKGIIVLTLVLTTSLGFIFGFFVGKYFRPPLERQAAGNGISPEASVSQPYSPSSESTTLTDKAELDNQPPASSQPMTEALVKNNYTPTQQVPATESSHANSTEPIAMKKQSSQENAKFSDIDKKNQSVSIAQKKIYAVQVGAYTNPDDARALKSKFDKKGYSSDIVIANGSQNKIYKILIGKFTSKDVAETFANRIKLAENIKAFVVLKHQ